MTVDSTFRIHLEGVTVIGELCESEKEELIFPGVMSAIKDVLV